jgi:hypothetical protein
MPARSLANRALKRVGLKLVPAHDQFVRLHDYGAGGMAKYRDTQIRWNKAKFDQVWADTTTLEAIASDIEARGIASPGLCHGARNGFEVQWFRDRLGADVIGTDISETAETVPNMVCHDFHDPRADWLGRFGFIYTNSLDQAFDPEKALASWAAQLAPNGRIYIEHTMMHANSSEMDPFGAHPMAVPYLLHRWGRGKYALDEIIELDGIAHKNKGRVWVFVVKAHG